MCFFFSRKIRTRYNAHSVKRLKNECKFIITNPLRREEVFHKIPLLVRLAEMSPCFCPHATAPTFSRWLQFPRTLSRVPGPGRGSCAAFGAGGRQGHGTVTETAFLYSPQSVTSRSLQGRRGLVCVWLRCAFYLPTGSCWRNPESGLGLEGAAVVGF